MDSLKDKFIKSVKNREVIKTNERGDVKNVKGLSQNTRNWIYKG